MHDRRSPSRSERRIALSFALMLPVLAGCNIYDSMVYGSRKGTVEYPGSGAASEPVTPAGPPGAVQAQSLPPVTGGGAPPSSAAGSLPPASGAAAGSAASGAPPGPAGAPAFGNQTAPAASPATPAPVPLPRGGGAQVATAEPPPAAAKPQFQWPVRGKVLAKYGPQPGGAKNDGIDIAAPSGAPVKAAAGGKVVYVGSGVATLGNVVLIQHPGGYVTAYAHTEQTLVKKDDVVSKGQTIATVGQTGNAKQPMLHFEVRQAKEPIDPSPLLGP